MIFELRISFTNTFFSLTTLIYIFGSSKARLIKLIVKLKLNSTHSLACLLYLCLTIIHAFYLCELIVVLPCDCEITA